MARGYIYKAESGELQAAFGAQGNLNEVDASEDYGYGREVRSRMKSYGAGLYRAKFTAEKIGRRGSGRVFCRVELGAKVADANAEAARLRDNAEKQAGRARTGSPGIAGYLQAEHAATARLQNNREESKRLAGWLESLAEQAEPRTLADLRDRYAAANHPAAALCDAIAEHSNSPEYLIGNLRAIVAALEAEHADNRAAMSAALEADQRRRDREAAAKAAS